jgi:hypothetical protein
MTNKASSFPAASAMPPLHRYGGVLASTPELAMNVIGDTYTVEGAGTVRTLPGWPKGPPITLYMVGSPTFVHSARLLMPGGRNYTFSPGDSCVLLPIGDGIWRVLKIFRVDGIGSLAQAVTGGRLTVSSGVAVMTTDVAAATSLFYAPSISSFISIYDGAKFSNYQFTSSDTDAVGSTLPLGSNWAANTLFDCFVTLKAGVVTLVTGPAWSSSTAGSSSRGYSLALIAGLQTNAASMTVRDTNSSTFTMSANCGTYVGTILTGGSAGQIDFKFGSAAAGGSAARAGVWNMYNRALGAFIVLDTNGGWNPTLLSTWEPYDNSSTNRITFVTGLADDPINVIISSVIATAATKSGSVGVGLNSTSVPYSRGRIFGVGSAAVNQQTGCAPNTIYAAVGQNFVQALQFADAASAVFATGSPTNQALTADWWW